MSEAREQLRFYGRGGEYFRIWVVNVTLTILTLGIYSAWAKVRRNRYIYGNLELAGSRFDYTARPLVILRGRLIALVLLALYIGGQFLFPPLTVIIFLLLLVVGPWLIVRARMFNLRYTTYRGISFGFQPSYAEAYTVLYLYSLVSIITFGLAAPYAHYRRSRWLVDHTRFGTRSLELTCGSRPFYVGYLLAGLIAVLALGPLLGSLGLTVPGAAEQSGGLLRALLPTFASVAILFISGEWMRAYTQRAVINATRIGAGTEAARLGCDWSLMGYLAIRLTNVAAIIASAGLLLPWAHMRMLRYQLNQTWIDLPDGLENVLAAQAEELSSMGDEISDVFDLDVGL